MHESPLFGSSVSISTMQISNRSRSVLTVSSVNSNHTGTYKCVAVNSPLTFPSQQSVNVFVLRKFAVFSCISENKVFYCDTHVASPGNKLELWP